MANETLLKEVSCLEKIRFSSMTILFFIKKFQKLIPFVKMAGKYRDMHIHLEQNRQRLDRQKI